MSRQIDRDNLTEADARYLNDRGLLSAEDQKKFGIVPEPPTGPDLADVPNMGDVDTVGEGTIYGMTPPPESSDATTPGDSTEDGETVPPYEEWSKKDLLEEINVRNEDRADDEKLAKSGTIAELAARLTEDDESEETA